jgi:hypothetical protein
MYACHFCHDEASADYCVVCGADYRGEARRKAASSLKPTRPQAPCDMGLFSDESLQLDLVEMLCSKR